MKRIKIYTLENALIAESEGIKQYEEAKAAGKLWFVCKPGYFAITSMVSKDAAVKEAKAFKLQALDQESYKAALIANGVTPNI